MQRRKRFADLRERGLKTAGVTDVELSRGRLRSNGHSRNRDDRDAAGNNETPDQNATSIEAAIVRGDPR